VSEQKKTQAGDRRKLPLDSVLIGSRFLARAAPIRAMVVSYQAEAGMRAAEGSEQRPANESPGSSIRPIVQSSSWASESA